MDEDFSALPLEDRLVHKVWKARLGAYEECIRMFENSRNEDDECFQLFNQQPDLIKKIVIDLNVVAQETGILAFSKYLELGANAQTANRCKNNGIITSLCEKGLSSSRAGTKAKSIDCLLLWVEVLGGSDGVVEEMLPFVTHRMPKLVAGVVNGLGQIVEDFGCSIVKPNPIIEVLPKLFAHADRNVRTETSKLTVELYKWMKDALVTILFDDLKPVQQKDLTKAFEPFQAELPSQKRLTRAQQEQQRQQEQQLQNGGGEAEGDVGDVNMDVDSNVPVAQFDPFELMQPIDVLSKIPASFSSKVSDSNWKERKAALEEVHEILSKAPKISPTGDYNELIQSFTRCMKDANIQVVQLAANCVEFIAKGSREKFHRYYSTILVPMLERTKEKKPSVADALANALDAVFESTSLSDILEGTIQTMSHKTPQVKISATDYLRRCLSNTVSPPTTTEVDTIMSIGVKLLSESQEPIRQASTQMIGTLMKITGQRELGQFLEKVDENRKTKIFKFFETAEVKTTGSAAKPTSVGSNTKPRPASSAPKPAFGAAKKSASSSIPSKRLATSPAKRPDQQQKVASYGRSLTGRPLASNNATIPKLSPAAPAKPDQMEIDSEELNELRQLRDEKKAWAEDKQKQTAIIEKLKGDNFSLLKELDHTKLMTEKANKEANNSTLMVQQKDSQILRLNNDMDNAKLKIRDLEQTIEMMRLQQKQAANKESTMYGSGSTSPYKSAPAGTTPGANGTEEPRSRITSGELSSRVTRLSIDSENRPDVDRTSPKKYEFGSYTPSESVGFNDNESWQKAAFVTSQLKARIEKMKARSKNPAIDI